MTTHHSQGGCCEKCGDTGLKRKSFGLLGVETVCSNSSCPCHPTPVREEDLEEIKQGSLYGYDLVLKVPPGARSKFINEYTLENHFKQERASFLQRLEEEVGKYEEQLIADTDTVEAGTRTRHWLGGALYGLRQAKALITNFKREI